MSDILRQFHAGILAEPRGNLAFFLTVKVRDGALSISGVLEPRHNGDADSCGQCRDVVKAKAFVSSHNLDAAKLLGVWDAWHLNHMRAGCEHQRATWDLGAVCEIVTYKMAYPTLRAQNTLKDDVIRRLQGETVNLSDSDRWLLGAPYTRKSPPNSESEASGLYEVDKREVKACTSTYPMEHKHGVLTKPCEVCGYKYGSAWLREELPPEVLAYVEALPHEPELLPRAWREW